MPYETFYPGPIMEHPEGDLCTVKEELLKEDDNYEFI